MKKHITKNKTEHCNPVSEKGYLYVGAEAKSERMHIFLTGVTQATFSILYGHYGTVFNNHIPLLNMSYYLLSVVIQYTTTALCVSSFFNCSAQR